MKDAGPRVSVVVATRDRASGLVRLLKALDGQDLAEPFEAVVVEDGPGTETRLQTAAFASAHPRLALQFLSQSPEGPSAARNRGASAARGRVLVFTDDDCAPPPSWLGRITAPFLRGDEDLVAGGPERAIAGASWTGRAADVLLTSFWTTLGVNGGRWRLLPFYPRSSNLACSRRVFERVGGFPAVWPSEDNLFVSRARASGARVAYLDDAWTRHERRPSVGSFGRQMFLYGKMRGALGRREPSSLTLAPFLPLLAVAVALSTVKATGGWLLGYAGLIALDGLFRERDLRVAFLAPFLFLLEITSHAAGFTYGLLTGRTGRRAT